MNFKSFPYHPFLIVCFQILSIYSINVNEVAISAVFIVLIGSLVITGVIHGFLSFFLDKSHGAIILSLYGFSFFVYGRLINFFIENPVLNLPLHRNKYFLPIFILFLIVNTLLIYKSDKCKSHLKIITSNANKFSAGLVIIAIITIGINLDWTKIHHREQQYSELDINHQEKNISLETNPNIYFLIFDSYVNQRILNQYYNWNDSLFVNQLVSRGFLLNKNARSNYCFTGASILSTLSMRFLHLDPEFENAYNQDNYIGQFYKKNDVMERFKSKGYNIVSNLGGKGWPKNYKKSIITDDFIQLVIHLSLLRIIENELITNKLRQNILFMLDSLKKYKKPKTPTFVCLHFMVPHSPFIFQADGGRPKYFESAFTKFEHKLKYIDQLRFTGSQIIEIADSIRKKDKNAIIIIQADHGFGGDDDMIYLNRNSVAAKTNNREKPPANYLDQRFGILNAIYSPIDLGIPDQSTPVNIFRYIFNKIFDDKYALLPNKSYFSLIKQPYYFHDVTKDIDNQINNDLE